MDGRIHVVYAAEPKGRYGRKMTDEPTEREDAKPAEEPKPEVAPPIEGTASSATPESARNREASQRPSLLGRLRSMLKS